MELIFETWPIERCVDYARNPRKNDHAVDKVAAAIREFGFRVPIVAKSDGLVVDGHLRLKATKKLGLTEVPVILADEYCDVIIKRWQDFTGQQATLEATGQTYDELKAEREAA
jgi:ParB-like chromosome segregation protein Spo0J